MGIEALSRGAARAIFVENNRAALPVLRANLKSLGLESRSQVLQRRSTQGADIVFLDPPYNLEREYTRTMEALGAELSPMVIAQHDIRLKLADQYGGLTRRRELRQGDNVLSFYEIS